LELAAEGSKQARAKVPIEEEALAALEAEITHGEERLKTLRGAVPITERQAALSDLRERLDEPRADIYLIRSKLRQSLREVVDFMVFGPDGGVTIGVESLAAAYRFENGMKVRREEWPLGPTF
jgi:hypothetical protein